MYSIGRREDLHPSLCAYIDSGAADAIGFNEKRKTYTYKRPDGHEMFYGGLVSKLKQLYYPHYKNSKRRKRTQKKGSNAKLGKRIDDEIMVSYFSKKKKDTFFFSFLKFLSCKMITASKDYKPGKNSKIKTFHKMTVRLVKELVEDRGHVLQCSQLPVKIDALGRITQADFITLDPSTQRLHMWELKTGYTPGMFTTKGKGTFAGKHLQDIPCTKYGIWELQRYWTERGLREAGLDIAQSNVINIYEDRKKGCLTCKIMDNLPWVYNLDATIQKDNNSDKKKLKRKRSDPGFGRQ